MVEENCTVSDTNECSGDLAIGGGVVVVVGVRLDSRSRELLTWALVKVARSGDRVIALHVLDPTTEGKSTLFSLVKTFDSMLAAYEGFCNLKQVDLKLKVCRGSSVRKILVQESKFYGAANVIVGTSEIHHKIRSSVSIARYCARNLPKNFSVTAVNNGKILYQRKATDSIGLDLRDCDRNKHYVRLYHHLLRKKVTDLNIVSADVAAPKLNKGRRPDSLEFKFSGSESLNVGNVDTSLALLPAKKQKFSESKLAWALLRRVFLHNEPESDKSSSVKKSVKQWLLKLPSRPPSTAVGPDHEGSIIYKKVDYSADADGEKNGAVVPSGTDIAFSPSPAYCLNSSMSNELEELAEKYSSTCRVFSYQELSLATSNFKPENVVGKGGSSKVYRGCLPDGKELAVKVLKSSENVYKQFVSEIEIIMTLHHKNTISLLGFCFEGNNLLLVYDFLSRGSLEQILHGSRKHEVAFGWEHRYKVALGVAEALDYLHNGAAKPVIHRDVKSSNILLSDDFEPQLSDFGLAMQTLDFSTHMTSIDVAGTFGYLAPEYFMHGKVNERIDVYAFGVVILELLSGRKPIDNGNPKGQESLVMWANSIMKDGKVFELLDPCLDRNYDHDQSERMVLAAALCIKRTPLSRPHINIVLKLLRGDIDVIKWARQEVSILEEIDAFDGDEFPKSMQSHLNLALSDFDDDSLSAISRDQNLSVEDYLQGRWSRSLSLE